MHHLPTLVPGPAAPPGPTSHAQAGPNWLWSWRFWLTITPILVLLLLGLVAVPLLNWPWWVTLAIWLGLLAYLVWLKISHDFQIIGPLGYFEMVRFARQGWTTWLRCLYALLLLLVLALVYRQFAIGMTVEVSRTEIGRLAESFTLTVLIFQNTVVLVLTPIYLCGAIIEERRRRTLEFLFTTPLRDEEIILGKFWARTGIVALLLVTGLPMFGLIQVWGGVEMHLVLGGVTATLLTLFHVGALSLYASTTRRSMAGALILTYTAIIFSLTFCGPFWYLASPYGFLLEIEARLRGSARWGFLALLFGAGTGIPAANPLTTVLWMMAEYAIIHGCLTIFWVVLAVRSLRKQDDSLGLLDPGIVSVQMTGVPTTPYSSKPPFFWLPIDDNRPLLHKEVYAQLYSSASLVLEFAGVVCSSLVLAVAVGLVLDGLLSSSSRNHEISERWLGVVSVFNCLLVALTCLGVLLRASSSITREREASTLETLLTLPVSRLALLGTKWLGSIWRFQLLLFSLLGLWLAALAARSLHPGSLVLLAMMVAAQLAFCASLGLWLSVICLSTTRANFCSVGIMLALILLPAWIFFDNPLVEALLNPSTSWWTLPFSWSGIELFVNRRRGVELRRLGSVLHIGLCVLAATLFWVLACVQFRATALLGKKE